MRDLITRRALRCRTRPVLCTLSRTRPFATATTIPIRSLIDENFAYEDCFASIVEKKREDGSYRYFRNINRLAANFPWSYSDQGKLVNNWCSNDYLGMSANKKVLERMHQTLDQYGVCSGGSRNISGHNNCVASAERALAKLHHKESALCTISGYTANDYALTVLGSLLPGCVFFSDASNHSSIIEGIRHSGAKKHVWRHNDLQDLEAKLASTPAHLPKIICFESIYSMCGTVAPIREIRDLAKRYNALTFLDEVHAIGLYGPHGAGVAEHLDFEAHARGHHYGTLADDIDIISGALGKGVGTMGGYVAGSSKFIDMVRSTSRGFIFTTAPPPVMTAGTETAIDFIRTNPADRMQLQRNVRTIKERLLELGLPVLPNTSHIVPLMVGDAEKCKLVADTLFDKYGVYVQPINSPSVPVGQERLRISPTAAHTEEHQAHLISALVEIWQKYDLKWLDEWKTNDAGEVQVGWESDGIKDSVWSQDQLSRTTVTDSQAEPSHIAHQSISPESSNPLTF